ncbi:MAG: hypothetical protein CSA23_00515 [Deltaproteobacteria bacterium]|nr:MAG: hypothetical protein CSA23_00515 [Deltaproteobacteria bacterium]
MGMMDSCIYSAVFKILYLFPGRFGDEQWGQQIPLFSLAKEAKSYNLQNIIRVGGVVVNHISGKILFIPHPPLIPRWGEEDNPGIGGSC